MLSLNAVKGIFLYKKLFHDILFTQAFHYLLPPGALFFSYLVEDKSQSGPSYVEFLVHVHREIQVKMSSWSFYASSDWYTSFDHLWQMAHYEIQKQRKAQILAICMQSLAIPAKYWFVQSHASTVKVLLQEVC